MEWAEPFAAFLPALLGLIALLTLRLARAQLEQCREADPSTE